MNGLVKTPFKLTPEEILGSVASTLCLLQLERSKVPTQSVADVAFPPQYGYTASASVQPCGPQFVRITDIKRGAVDWNRVPFCECKNPEGYQLDSGDILVARSGSVGKSFLVDSVPGPAVFASYMIRLRAKPGNNPRYLYWCLQSQQFWQQVMGARRGSAMNNINGKMLAALRFPWPTSGSQKTIGEFLEAFKKRLGGGKVGLPELGEPLSSVGRIVSRIEELAAKIEEARIQRQESSAEAEALWERSLVATFEKMSAVHPPVRFGEVCKVVRGGSPRPAGSPVYYGGEIPFLKVADLTRSENKYLTEHTFTIKEAGLRKTRRVEANTLMLTNSGATLGVPKIVTFATCFNDGIQAFLNPPQDISREYLYYFFRSKTLFFREWVARGQGQPNLNTDMVKTMPFPRPPLHEQRRIVAYLDDLQAKVDSLKKLQSETAAELDALMPSILAKVFRGEL